MKNNLLRKCKKIEEVQEVEQSIQVDSELDKLGLAEFEDIFSNNANSELNVEGSEYADIFKILEDDEQQEQQTIEEEAEQAVEQILEEPVQEVEEVVENTNSRD